MKNIVILLFVVMSFVACDKAPPEKSQKSIITPRIFLTDGAVVLCDKVRGNNRATYITCETTEWTINYSLFAVKSFVK